MKKILFILLIIIAPLLLISCTEEEVDSNHLIQNPISTEEISQIDIELADYKKSFIDDNNINLLVDYLNRIQKLEDASPNINVDDEPIRIRIYDSNNSIIESITIGSGVVNYNKTWYFIDTKVYEEITEFYETLDFNAVENQLIIEINNRVANRRELPIEEILQGTWLSIDGSIIKFDSDILTQGDQTKNNFGYNIENTNNNQMEITVYGLEGIFLDGRELSTLDIVFDPTKSHMKMRRIMVGGRISEDKLIYVDEEGVGLGSFDSYFFFEGL